MYSLEDCILIRKTDIFPKDGIVVTPVHGNAYSFGSSSILGDAISKELKKMYLDMDEYLEESKKYHVFFETCRSTVHFAINGIVADSIYGNFSYPYAILEPLKYHIQDKSLLGLRVEDTYFQDDVVLSNESVVFIPKNQEISLREKYDFSGLSIVTYTGSLEEAITSYCREKKYPLFLLGDHGYSKGSDSNMDESKMTSYICQVAEENGISQEKHFYSDINYQDSQIRDEKAEVVDLKHLEFILDSGLVSSETVEKIREYLPMKPYFKKELETLCESLVEEVGLKQLYQLTKDFNEKMIHGIDEKNK